MYKNIKNRSLYLLSKHQTTIDGMVPNASDKGFVIHTQHVQPEQLAFIQKLNKQYNYALEDFQISFLKNPARDLFRNVAEQLILIFFEPGSFNNSFFNNPFALAVLIKSIIQ